ncbi:MULTISPECIES: response regulator [unclassified Janthinobacterium]|uniref:response regulator n=1 Tax=unclassified Janthinobacterium TaxID=2610881 RepID=UPI0018CA9C70|nr:response regulator [Janthinobacterium sp. CG_23.4]MDH6158036.1 two-component system chemotaxis response regulator CheY [Janthinobacterium sp. CG_23.4]
MKNNRLSTPVIIAEDEPLMREVLASMLRGFGYRAITFAVDGRQAAQLLELPEYRSALVFLDIHMPKMDGMAVLEHARSVGSNAFMVMVSADSSLDRVLAALSGGAKGFVIKPYTTQKILDITTKFERALIG